MPLNGHLLSLQEFLLLAYTGFVSPETVALPTKRILSNNSSNSVNNTNGNSNGNGNHNNVSNNNIVRHTQSFSAVIDAGSKKSPEQAKDQSEADPGPVRLRLCCRSGCTNICLSTAPSSSRYLGPTSYFKKPS